MINIGIEGLRDLGIEELGNLGIEELGNLGIEGLRDLGIGELRKFWSFGIRNGGFQKILGLNVWIPWALLVTFYFLL